MAKYFSRIKYQTEIISEEFFKIWQKENPQFKATYSQFLKYWRHLRAEICDGIIENPAGVDLPFFLGNLSIKVIDLDFKCAKDFLRSNLTNKETGEFEKRPFIQSEIPKKIKMSWVKHKLFKALPSIFGVETSRTMKKVVSRGVREKGVNYFQKAFRHKGIASRCEDIPEKSAWDQAD